MSFANQVVVIPGATGDVGSGAVRGFLDAGATVVAISREARKLEALRAELQIGPNEPFLGVVGDFRDEASALAATNAVHAALGGRAIDHVISTVGFVTMADVATNTPVALVQKSLDDGFFNTLFVARSFLAGLKARSGSSFTMVSGGLAHWLPAQMPGAANLWLATVKNAAVNALTLGLAAECANDAVRVNTLCIHVGVARVGGNKNQLGMPAEQDTLALAPAFLSISGGTKRGEVICMHGWGGVESLGS